MVDMPQSQDQPCKPEKDDEDRDVEKAGIGGRQCQELVKL
jgi:hypothetical protein